MAAVKGAGEAGRGEARRQQGAVGEVPGGDSDGLELLASSQAPSYRQVYSSWRMPSSHSAPSGTPLLRGDALLCPHCRQNHL